ncbi:hypothetical protein EJ02DRAFT_381455 [Clathrospora elynae]|uniref:Cora-domain-containing protein n=1 Tax=Clathrospora elynae TaxID=706981 RepID=A0A6A5SG21_9PLEO|nr:hypothetical protein EJ02DRAFT_381455 [Clathrospora elynae]
MQNTKSLPPIRVQDTDLVVGEGSLPRSNPEEAPRASITYTSRPPFDPNDSQPLPERRKATFGHHRKHSPNLKWREPWTKKSWSQGRVLIIDYVAKAHTSDGKRKIAAQEFCDIDSLRHFYRKEDLSAQSALRVIHVQNASWATRYLLRKFNIDTSDDLVGTTFGRWAQYEKPQQRGGKPVLNGKTFRTQRDPWRGISRTAFGCDYLKHYPKNTPIAFPSSGYQKPMMELNHYDDMDQPRYGYDVYVQRLSVYVQLRESGRDGNPSQAVDPDIPNPYDEEAYGEYQRLKRSYGGVEANEQQEKSIPKLRSLDNGNTIIIFENSVTGSVKDTLIGARQELESRWRRLTFYLPREEMDSDDMMTAECMDFILKDVFKAMTYHWDKFLGVCETHVGILEDKIYENPADESRAPELWKNSAQWLKVERLIYIHADLVREMVPHMHELAGSDPRENNTNDPWLGSAPDDMDKLTGQWERDVVLPTTALSDLMYKSVGIRDARHSLQLGLSMWRLSWITFIFLPLTFTVGFFGMNVDTFENNPDIKWWFVTSVPVLVVVVLLWYAVKHNLASQRQNPMRRGVYEALYHELATEYDTLWTRGGPRGDVVPVGWWGGVKWRLVTNWFSGEKLRLRAEYDPATEEFGMWSRVKRGLAKRWLRELAVMQIPTLRQNEQDKSLDSGEETLEKMDRELGALGELLSIATPVAIAEMDPVAASRLQRRIPIERLRSVSLTRSDQRPTSSGRPSSDGGIMVEEKGVSEDERSGYERPAKMSLNVPH